MFTVTMDPLLARQATPENIEARWQRISYIATLGQPGILPVAAIHLATNF